MKRILSFDGGGIRGIFSLQIAAKIEQHFRTETQNPNLVLADVVDLFAGTSTGAIIATCLAWGASVKQVEQLYIDHGAEMFAPERWWRRLKSKYRADAIADFFKQYFQEDDKTPALLGSKKLKKLLLIVMRNATTGSPWPVSNNPHALYNDPLLPANNLNLPLWQLLRGSTAAPSFFPPEEIAIADEKFLFVDGGVTPFNNPALLAALTATLPCYRINWPASRENLHLISIGTGSSRSHFSKTIADNINLLDHIHFVAPALIGACAANQDMLCRILGDCLHGAPLDSEIGCLDAPSLLAPDQQKFTYVRYNANMDTPESGAPMTSDELQLDNLHALAPLQQVGQHYANSHVLLHHLHPRKTEP